MRKQKYYDFISKKDNLDNKIRSDSALVLLLIKDILRYILLFIPYIFGFLIYLIIGNKKESNKFIEKIFFEPFRLFYRTNEWFFEAKITSSLFFLLIVIYLVQVFFLKNIMTSIMTHPLHLFQGNFYSIITSIFLHADLIHLGSNLLALIIFGRIVENQFKSKTLLIFLASGIVANIISNLISYSLGEPYFYSLGASGAIAGLIIFAILINPFSFTSLLLVPLPIFVVGWFLIFTDITGLTNPSQTNNLAHLGGYLTLLLIFFFLEFKDRKKIISGFMINLVILLIVYLIIKIFGTSLNFINII